MSKLKIINAEPKHLPMIIELWNELMEYHSDLDAIWEKCHDGNGIFSKYVKNLPKCSGPVMDMGDYVFFGREGDWV